MKTDEEVKIFGKNIKKLRKQSGMSQKNFAAKFDIGVGSLRLIEKGVLPNRLSVDFLMKVCSSYGISPSKIFVIL